MYQSRNSVPSIFRNAQLGGHIPLTTSKKMQFKSIKNIQILKDESESSFESDDAQPIPSDRVFSQSPPVKFENISPTRRRTIVKTQS